MKNFETVPYRSCAECPKYIYKGDDEQYCHAAYMREISLKKWQRKPKWCPIDSMQRREEAKRRATNENRCG